MYNNNEVSQLFVRFFNKIHIFERIIFFKLKKKKEKKEDIINTIDEIIHREGCCIREQWHARFPEQRGKEKKKKREEKRKKKEK